MICNNIEEVRNNINNIMSKIIENGLNIKENGDYS